MPLTFDQLVFLLTPEGGVLQTAGNAFGTRAIQTLFDAYFADGTMALTGAISVPDSAARRVTVSGIIAAGTLLGLPRATLASGVFTLLDDGTVTALLPVPVNDDAWTPAASFPALNGTLIAGAVWTRAVFTLDSAAATVLPPDFRARFGYAPDVDRVAKGMVRGLSLSGTATFNGGVGAILDLMFSSPIPVHGAIETFFQAEPDDPDDRQAALPAGGWETDGFVPAPLDEWRVGGGVPPHVVAHPQLLLEPVQPVGKTVSLGSYEFTFQFELGALLQEFPATDGSTVDVFPMGALRVQSDFEAPGVSVPISMLLYEEGGLVFHAFGAQPVPVSTGGLPALLNGASVSNLLAPGHGFPVFDAVTVNDVSVTLATKPSFALQGVSLQVTIGAEENWSLFSGFITIQEIGLLIAASDAGQGWTAEASVHASAVIAHNPHVTLDAYVTLPDVQFEVQLTKEVPLDLTGAVSDLIGTSIPLPTFTGGTFAVSGSVADGSYTFTATLHESWTIFGETTDDGLTLGDLTLVLGTSEAGVTGSVYAQLTLGGVPLYVSADYQPGGAWTFAGGTGPGQSVDLTALFGDLTRIFGIDVPPGLPEIDLAQLDIRYDTGSRELDIVARVSIPGTTVDLTHLPLVGPYLDKADSLTLAAIEVNVSWVPGAPANVAMTFDVAVGTLTHSTVAIQLSGGDPSGTTPRASGPLPASGEAPASAEGVGAPPVTYPVQGSGAWISIQRSFGPILVQKLGFTLDSGGVGVQINATFVLSGLAVDVLGLGVKIPLRGGGPSFGINGLNVSYAAGSVAFDGGLLKVSESPLKFDGELVIRAESFALSAFGSYATGESPSFFVFGMVNDVPIGGPPFFFVTGFSGGFGFNRSLVLPSIDQVASYPLVAGANQATSPFGQDPSLKDFLSAMDQHMGVSIGQDWIAAGIEFTTYEILQSYALLTVAFGTRLQIALLGLSTISVPPLDSEPVAQAQLTIEAVFSPDEGEFTLSAQLTPASYVLSKDCQLTGGFAWYMWFDPSPFAGDFVVTLGGYNPYFAVPPHYPTVPRLGFNWAVRDTPLVIKGGMYLALTPHAFMVGGSLEAVWESGPIRAWFAVNADFLIYWKPFSYDARLGVSFGVCARVDLFLVTIPLQVTVGASLHLWGPDFSGVAVIDLHITSFTISFGPQPGKPAPISWTEFRDSFLGGSRVSERALAAAKEGESRAPVLTALVPTGLLRDLTAHSQTVQYVVDPQRVTFVTQTKVPAKQAELNGAAVTVSTTGPTAPWPQDFGVGPMAVDPTQLTSEHRVCISRNGGVSDRFAAAAVLGSAPKGLWVYEPSLTTKLNDATQVAGVVVGLALVPLPPMQDQTLPIDIQTLLFEAEDQLPWRWAANPEPSSDPFGGLDGYSQLTTTIDDPGVAEIRAGMVGELMANGFLVNNLIDTSALAGRPTLGLLAPPVLNLLGENPALANG